MTSDTAEMKLGSIVAAALPQVSGRSAYQYLGRGDCI